MKILFLTSEGFDTPNSINHLCESLIEDILKSGIKVHLISSHKTGKYADIPESLLKYQGLKYDIVHRKMIDKNNFVKRYLDEVKYAFRAMALWRKHRSEYDAILLQSNPNSVVNAILLSIIVKKPIILNLYDVFPGHAMSIGVIKNRFLFNVLRLIQRVLYKKCKYIVAMSEDMKKQLLNENVSEEKIEVINNWFDDSMFTLIEKDENQFLRKYELDPGKFYVQFAGLLGHVFDYKMFIDVADKLKDNTNIVFLLIGDGNQKQMILNEISNRNLINIKYFPWQPLAIIADVYSACDIGLIPLKPGVIGNGIPSKACQLMAASRVIINSVEESEYTRLFDTYRMGVNVVNHSADSVAEAIEYLYLNYEERITIGENARQYAYKHYSRTENTAKFVRLIKRLADGN
jgi:glycosyltransferase involved in cell wall biosynthesis